MKEFLDRIFMLYIVSKILGCCSAKNHFQVNSAMLQPWSKTSGAVNSFGGRHSKRPSFGIIFCLLLLLFPVASRLSRSSTHHRANFRLGRRSIRSGDSRRDPDHLASLDWFLPRRCSPTKSGEYVFPAVQPGTYQLKVSVKDSARRCTTT